MIRSIVIICAFLSTSWCMSQKFTQMQANALLDLGKLYDQQKNPHRALHYLQQAAQAGEPVIREEAEALALTTVSDLATAVNDALDRTPPAYHDAYKSLETLASQNFDARTKYDALDRLGNLFLSKKIGNDPSLAIPYFVELSEQTDPKFAGHRVEAQLKLAKLYLGQDNYALSKKYFQKLADQNGAPELQKFGMQKLEEIKAIEEQTPKKKKKKKKAQPQLQEEQA